MSGQTFRWGMAFAATATLSASLVLSAAKAPEPVAAASVAKRDPASVSDLELELILNKIREGDLLSQKKDEAGSARAWEDARRLGEGLWPVHEGLGDSYARAKRYDDAQREYQTAASLVPDKHAAMRQTIAAKRGGVQALASRPLDALRTYLDLNQPEALGGRMLALATEPAALGMIERHAEVYDPRLFRLVWAAQMRLGRKVEAAEALAKVAVRVSPWDVAINRQAIQGLREAGRFDVAIDVCRAWVRALPQSVDGYELMGDLLWDAGREREAFVAYSSLVDVRPGDAAAHRRLGDVYRRRNRPEEAMAQFERGLKAAPQDQELRDRIVPATLAKLETLRAQGKSDEVRALRQRLAGLNVPEAGLFDIKVVMTWDAMSDVDMDIVEPDGTRINHGNMTSKVGGAYYTDNTKGLGPETYTVRSAKPGTWRIGAHLHSGARSSVKFVVILFEDTPKEERREETVILEKTGDAVTFVRDIVIP